MRRPNFGELRAALFLFLFFSLVAGLQIYFIGSSADALFNERLNKSAERAKRAVAFWQRGDLKDFNKAPIDDNTMAMLADGTIIDYQMSARGLPKGLLPEVLCPVLPVEAFRAPVRTTYRSGPVQSERWTLYARRLDQGVVILGISEHEDVQHPEDLLRKNASDLGETFASANRLGPHAVENSVSWALIDDHNMLINGSGRIPLKTTSALLVGQKSQPFSHEKLGTQDYYVAYSPILDSNNRLIGTAILFDEVTSLYRALDYSLWFNVAIATLSISLFLVLALLQYRKHENKLRRLSEAVRNHFSPQIFDLIQRDPERLKECRREVAILFSDIRSFTSLAEQIPTQQLTRLLHDYFSEMTDAVFATDGVLDKYIGDAVMAFWGAPIEQPDPANRAVLTALDMMRRLKTLREKWAREGFPTIDIGIGIHFGTATVGLFGSAKRFDYTAIGDAVNTASRLESLNKQYQSHIIISESAKKQLTISLETRDLGRAQVRGREESIRIFEVLTA